MIGSMIFCVFFMCVVCSIAAPITENIVLDPNLSPIDILKHKHKSTRSEKLAKLSARQDRQGFAYSYPSYPYDYYSYSSPYYNENSFYPNYERPQVYYPYSPPAAPAPLPVYAPTHSHTTKPNRRGYRPSDRIEATSQKYTIWDLARK